jgi:predicted Zn finger-like uncharacterized protein
MDVRCDRCQTEYELDDDSVTEAGASVQCTSCGHTFVVGRTGATIAGVPALAPGGGPIDLPGPQPADWLLATEDGQTHRFRDLTTLQKWIVERKVTREDRVSQKGGRWRELADVSELAPFFDVVAQADRARSAELSRRANRPAGTSSGTTPTRQSVVSRQTAARMRRDTGGASGPGRPSIRHDSSRSPLILDSDPVVEADSNLETLSILNGQRRLRIAGLTGMVALAVVAAYVGFKQPHWLPFFKPAESARVVEAPAPPAVPPRAPAPPPARPRAQAPTEAPPPPVAPAVEPMANGKSGSLQRAAPGDPVAGVKGKSYERLVADADRLMENGQPARAQKLLEEALAIQPNGVAAVTGSAFLLLDRQKPLAAISMFKRALGSAPDYAPALFGLGEAYRAEGDATQAAESYRRYLAVAPAGPDASAARRQLKELESALPRRPAESEGAKAEIPPPAAADEP